MSAPVGTLVSLALSLLTGRIPSAILAEVRRFLEALESRILAQEDRITGLERRVAARRAAKLDPERIE